MKIDLPEHLLSDPNILLRYRPNAAMIILNPQDQILWCERIDHPNVWQFPQGGIDEGENAEQAMWRELSEELGIMEPQNFMKIEARLAEPLCYNFPISIIEIFLRKRGHSYIGQGQYFFLLRWHGDDDLITLQPMEEGHQEFSRFVWGDDSYLRYTSPFKTEVTRRALHEFGLM